MHELDFCEIAEERYACHDHRGDFLPVGSPSKTIQERRSMVAPESTAKTNCPDDAGWFDPRERREKTTITDNSADFDSPFIC
jgi:hypothetical protein